jgi:hypothetical protein
MLTDQNSLASFLECILLLMLLGQQSTTAKTSLKQQIVATKEFQRAKYQDIGVHPYLVVLVAGDKGPK